MLPIRVCLIALLAFAMFSCARLPVAELTAYSENVTAAKTAGNQILDLVSPALAGKSSAPKQPCARNSQGVRPCFAVDLALGGSQAQANEPVDIQLRRLAFEVIETYTLVLVDISEGRSAQVVRARGTQLNETTRTFQSALAGLVPAAPLGPIISAATEVAASITNASAHALGVRSVTEAEPDIRKLLQLLIADTPTLYDVYRSQFIADRGDLVLKKRELEILGSGLEGAALEENQRQIRQLAAQIHAARSGSGNAVQLREFEEALTNYVRILDTTDAALVALRRAITLEATNPIDRVSEFARRSAETRVWLDQLEDNLSNLRSTLR